MGKCKKKGGEVLLLYIVLVTWVPGFLQFGSISICVNAMHDLVEFLLAMSKTLINSFILLKAERRKL